MSDSNFCDSTLLLLRGFDIFQHITEEEYEELALVHNYVEAASGAYIYFPHQNRNKLYFAKDGFIKLGYIDESGNEVIKEIIQKGEVFGQLTLEKNNDQDEFAQAYKSDVSLCAFTMEDFIRILQRKPEMAIAFSFHLGNKLRKVENRLLNILNKDVKSRLAQLLLQLANDKNGVVNNTAAIDKFLTHDDIAKLIGSSRQTVTTTLNQFEKENIITVTKKEILINDVAGLKKIGEG
ncbi:MAG: Crp/Fnr family transcriptional regulator [Chitinophagaceae bacterium]|nr:Crp/Fnr family transcriptional regulator [Chitinophagaceae bacterium]